MHHLRINLAFNPDNPHHKRVYDQIAAQGRGNQSSYVIDFFNEHSDVHVNSIHTIQEEQIRAIIREELSRYASGKYLEISPQGAGANNSVSYPEASDDSVSEDDQAALRALVSLGKF